MRPLRALAAGATTLLLALLPSGVSTAAELPTAARPACPHGYVALTFDDGPSTTTDAILNALHDNGGARATFFNIGAQEQLHPDLVREEQAAGQRAGDHTYSHPFLDELSATDAANEILGTQQIHEQITGVRERLFRPPYGRTTPAIREAARSMGMTEVLWTIDTQDYAAGTTTEDILASALSAHDGDIVLMHDAGYATTVAALPAILRGLVQRGLCPGRVVPTHHPVTAWPGMQFYATAARW
jgi:peptidoglycan/xylan/chitin deacetylase (PgdA/CDA1 family)